VPDAPAGGVGSNRLAGGRGGEMALVSAATLATGGPFRCTPRGADSDGILQASGHRVDGKIHRNINGLAIPPGETRAPPGQPLQEPRQELPRLVPRTRSSHHNCRESDCELRVQSGTRIIELLVSFDSEVRFGACGKFGRTSESGH
jgi:succinate dehydrogenase/fumarate reductase flavoprotein subunit